MRQNVMYSILFVWIALFVSGCSSDDSNSLKPEEPKSSEESKDSTGADSTGGESDKPVTFDTWSTTEEEWPEWAIEKAPSVPLDSVGSNSIVERPSRASYVATQEAVQSFRYLVNHGKGQKFHTYWTLMLGVLLERLREDHLAHEQFLAVQASGESEIEITYIKKDNSIGKYTVNFQDRMGPALLGIYSRNGFMEELEATATKVRDTVAVATEKRSRLGDVMVSLAKAYMVAGEPAKAIAAFEGITDSTNYRRTNKRASVAVGASSILFRLGAYEKLLSVTKWMVDEGENSTYIGDSKPNGYGYDQWKSSYKQVMAWRALAQAGKNATFETLKDGTYEITAQGFRGDLKVAVTIAGDKISAVTIGADHIEDRAYTSLVVIPERVEEKQSLLVDGVTSATVTSGAVEYSVVKALLDASK